MTLQLKLNDLHMNILALDTTTHCCTVALCINDQHFALTQLTQRGHSALILGMMEQLLKQANAEITQIEAIAFGCGPGSFTGVRIGVGVAQGIAFARNLPVVAVSSLAAVAQQAYQQFGYQRLAVATDARMNEIYAGSFIIENGIAQPQHSEKVCPADAFKPLDSAPWAGVGSGWSVYAETLSNNFKDQLDAVETSVLPEASAVLTLAQVALSKGLAVPAAQALPVYLRNNVALKKGQQ